MKTWVKVFLGIVGCLAGIYLVLFTINVFCNVGLRNYIKSFDKVEYGPDRIVPEKIDGFYTITTDSDLEIMHLTDIHIGGGFCTYKRDKKSIYEVITMLQAQKPDIVILGGDNTYCVPSFGFGGGNTFNNKMVAKTLISIFEHEQVYFSLVFGNHDTEAYDYANRQQIGNLYMNEKYKYCFFDQQFSDLDSKTIPSVTNQFIIAKNTEGQITKLILLIDSNDYISKSLMSSIKGEYDVIHDAQVDWAAETIKQLSEKAGLENGKYLKTICFMHIPIGEYQTAYEEFYTDIRDEKGNIIGFERKTSEPKDTKFIEGEWGEIKICYGGINDRTKSPSDQDKFFEVLCDSMQSVEAIFCGHDHTNNAVLNYKGVLLDYGYSVDNTAYGKKIAECGIQRGATVITLKNDGSFLQKHKNAYIDYGCNTDEFFHVDVTEERYPDLVRTVE